MQESKNRIFSMRLLTLKFYGVEDEAVESGSCHDQVSRCESGLSRHFLSIDRNILGARAATNFEKSPLKVLSRILRIKFKNKVVQLVDRIASMNGQDSKKVRITIRPMVRVHPLFLWLDGGVVSHVSLQN